METTKIIGAVALLLEQFDVDKMIKIPEEWIFQKSLLLKSHVFPDPISLLIVRRPKATDQTKTWPLGV